MGRASLREGHQACQPREWNPQIRAFSSGSPLPAGQPLGSQSRHLLLFQQCLLFPWPALGTLLAGPQRLLAALAFRRPLNCGQFLLQRLQLRGKPANKGPVREGHSLHALPRPRSHTFRQRAGNGLKPQGLGGPTREALATACGPESWDAEAGGWGPLGLACLTPWTTQVYGSVLSTSVYCSPRSSCTCWGMEGAGMWGGACAGLGARLERDRGLVEASRGRG